MRNLKRVAASAILLAVLAGAMSPKEGDFIELRRALTGLASDDFSDEQANAKFIIQPHVLGRIDEVKPLAGGTFGLLITLRTGAHWGERAWIDYNPARDDVSLCSVDLDSCPVARRLLEARAVRTEAPMPALPAAAVPASPAGADPWTRIPPPRGADSAQGLATVSAGFIPAGADDPPRAVVPSPGNSPQGADDDANYTNAATRWVSRRLEEPARLTGRPDPSCGAEARAPVARLDGCYNLSPEYNQVFQGNPDFRRMSGRARKQAFLDYIGPIAVRVQQYTRIPASVLIGQAALESGWGSSNLAVYGHDLFGITCSTPGEQTRYPIREFGDHGNWTSTGGRCDSRFPRNSGGRGGHVSFAHTYQSVFAYASTLLATEYYPRIRSAIARAPAYQAASWSEVVQGLGPYSIRGYGSQVADLIRTNHLDWYDHIHLCDP